MWNWIGVAAGIFILFITLEESVYYLWNRYVFGPKDRKASLLKKIILEMAFIIGLRLIEFHRKNTHKVSPGKPSM